MSAQITERFDPQTLFERVLVGADGSEAGLEATRQAARLAAPGGSLEVFTAVHLAEASMTGLSAMRVAAKLEREAAEADREALAVAGSTANGHVVDAPPLRSILHLLDSPTWVSLAAIGTLVGGVTAAAFFAGRAFGGDVDQTMAFATLALSELALVFAMRSRRVHAWRLQRNRSLLWSAIGSAALVVAAVYVPALQGPLATHALGPTEAAVTFALALVPFTALEAAKALPWPRRQ